MSNFIEIHQKIVKDMIESCEDKIQAVLFPKKIRNLKVRYFRKDKYFEYLIDEKKVTRQEAKNYLELQKTKLADLL